MTHWMCTNCGYYFQGVSPPNRCPSCEQSCAFNNVTNYLPEGGGGKIDQMVAGFTVKAMTGAQPQARSRRAPTLEALPPVHIFGSLTEGQREKVRSLEHTEVYEANAIICRQGDEANKLYLVEEGQVSVQYELPNGTQIPVAVVSSGGAFGWSVLIWPYQLTANVVALSKTRANTIKRDALLALMRTDPKTGLLIMQDIASIIASRLRNLEVEMIELVRGH